MTKIAKNQAQPPISSLASDQFVGTVSASAIEKATQEAREVEREAQDYLLSRVKPESRIRYR